MPPGAELHIPKHPVRVVTATSLFDGHDAAINIVRRILQSQGAEVIHLGHNRSVDEVVQAVVQEDADAVAVSSYQGGHMEYFTYLVQQLAVAGAQRVKVYGGGGGVIPPEEIDLLAAGGVRIFSPEDGQRMGLEPMVNTIMADCELPPTPIIDVEGVLAGSPLAVARSLSAVELRTGQPAGIPPIPEGLHDAARVHRCCVVGVTGTGGSGKSSLTDELLARFRLEHHDKTAIAVLAVDPNRRRGGGALLGDRIRMNSISGTQVFFRSVGTRDSPSEVPACLPAMIGILRAAGFDVVFVETPGIGQRDSAVTAVADLSLYVMTPEFGAASQLEKIEMLDEADVVAINKFDRHGAQDALRDVRRQMARNRGHLGTPDEMPVFATVASRFNDDGVTALYQHLARLLVTRGVELTRRTEASVMPRPSTASSILVPSDRIRYLAEVADVVRGYHRTTTQQAAGIASVGHLEATRDELDVAGLSTHDVESLLLRAHSAVSPESSELLAQYERDAGRLTASDRPARTSPSGIGIPRIATPRIEDRADLYRWLRRENIPGRFPFTGGVFETRRDDEDPTRMFAGEGSPRRTNRRFHMLADGQPATRLSTAFDSVTLYGADPSERPDVYGKVGTSGVSVATLDDMRELYAGFDLIDESTSVSMTINGPAPAVLAMYLNTAIDQHPELEPAEVLRRVRGTVQADILKEDQGQNTCILSTEFALSMMADIQQWFIDNGVRNFYSVSISGYHIAEAGANPITQLAFTLANGFTYVEAFLARGMGIDDFAGNLSFFFSNGMDPEYTVLGRVARRIWAVAMRDRYGAGERGQKLKYHVQTSGRSLHAQEMAFNDIRTTLQALCAIYDNANSLHTNAYDEALTTPTDESVRRAMAIQLIVNREWGLAYNDNPLQGSFIVEELTDLVEAAVLGELEAISERGGVLGAMETGYQRGRIQDESMRYEQAKHDGSLPIIGVNTFQAPGWQQADRPSAELRRSDDEEKRGRIEALATFRRRHSEGREPALAALEDAVLGGHNTFEALMRAVRHCTLGDITERLFVLGGRYRRNT